MLSCNIRCNFSKQTAPSLNRRRNLSIDTTSGRTTGTDSDFVSQLVIKMLEELRDPEKFRSQIEDKCQEKLQLRLSNLSTSYNVDPEKILNFVPKISENIDVQDFECKPNSIESLYDIDFSEAHRIRKKYLDGKINVHFFPGRYNLF
ncbi:MAG: hypothetical protein MHMPM18_001539 [Marteilia pararefringens]